MSNFPEKTNEGVRFSVTTVTRGWVSVNYWRVTGVDGQTSRGDVGQYSIVSVNVLCEIELPFVLNLAYTHNINDRTRTDGQLCVR